MLTKKQIDALIRLVDRAKESDAVMTYNEYRTLRGALILMHAAAKH